jgi:hypothetical protein
MKTDNTQDLIIEFGQLCINLWLHSGCSNFLLFKLRVIDYTVFEYYSPIYKITPEPYPTSNMYILCEVR